MKFIFKNSLNNKAENKYLYIWDFINNIYIDYASKIIFY